MNDARLRLELETLEAMLARRTRAQLRLVSSDLLYYEIVFEVRTLVQGDDRVVHDEERLVPVAYDLAPSHPVVPPMAVALQRDLFNPHVRDPRQKGVPLPPIPLICLGGFPPATRRLADWVTATYYLLAYAKIATSHGLNPDAVEYARREMGNNRFPTDPRAFVEPVRPAERSTA